jgi:hypothetical protein
LRSAPLAAEALEAAAGAGVVAGVAVVAGVVREKASPASPVLGRERWK